MEQAMDLGKEKQEENMRSICILLVKTSSQAIGKTVPLMQDSFGAGPSPLKYEFSRAKKRWNKDRLVWRDWNETGCAVQTIPSGLPKAPLLSHSGREALETNIEFLLACDSDLFL